MYIVFLKRYLSTFATTKLTWSTTNNLGYQCQLKRLKFDWLFGYNRSISPPRAQSKPWVISVHGKKISDPYHWLKDQNNPAVMKYLQQENAYADKVMANTTSLQSNLVKIMTAVETQIMSPPEVTCKSTYCI